MADDQKTASDAERQEAKEHSRRITKWLLDSRLAAERQQRQEKEEKPKRKAA